jgi:subtilase family serine protease
MKPVSVSRFLALFVAMMLGGCGGGALLGPMTTPQSSSASVTRTLSAPLGPTSILPGATSIGVRSLCDPSPDSKRASCLGSVRIFASSTTASSPGGLRPNDLAAIYGFPAPASQSATSQVVGIVVAYDSPSVESDLAAYRSYFGLPPCTSANGCFKKVGAAAPSTASTATTASLRLPGSVSANPTTNLSGWAAEADADVETLSGVCSGCEIVLAEAASDQLGDLGNAVTAAIDAGATIVNASFGALESSDQPNYAPLFENSKAKVVAASGDDGPQMLFPAASSRVIAVGGTTLNVSGSTVTESLWSGSGGGCSAYFGKPPWQPNWGSCSKRSVADVSAVADPNTGVAFYDAALGGWGIVGGTSVAAPIITGMYALSGDTAALTGAQRLYANSKYFVPVGDQQLTGLGVPTGLAAF